MRAMYKVFLTDMWQKLIGQKRSKPNCKQEISSLETSNSCKSSPQGFHIPSPSVLRDIDPQTISKSNPVSSNPGAIVQLTSTIAIDIKVTHMFCKTSEKGLAERANPKS